jgi:hypothetical protein
VSEPKEPFREETWCGCTGRCIETGICPAFDSAVRRWIDDFVTNEAARSALQQARQTYTEQVAYLTKRVRELESQR